MSDLQKVSDLLIENLKQQIENKNEMIKKLEEISAIKDETIKNLRELVKLKSA